MLRIFVLCVITSLLSGCAVPSFEATQEQREADLNWIFATFDRNYAPQDWKKKKLGVDIKKVKEECFEANKLITTNDEFRALIHKCVSAFQDAHTRSSIMGSLLPGKAKVYHLGFTTQLTRYKENSDKPISTAPNKTSTKIKTKADIAMEEVETDSEIIEKESQPLVLKSRLTTETKPTPTIKEALLVKNLLPANRSGAVFPVKKEDLIIAINGMGVKDYLKTYIVPFMNLGQEDASLTVAALNFPIRSGLKLDLPDTENDIVLTIKSNRKIYDVSLAWAEEDLVRFNERQQEASKKEKAEVSEEQINNETKTENQKLISLKGNYSLEDYFLGFNDIKNMLKNLLQDNPIVQDRLSMLLNSGFKVVDFNPELKLFENFANSEDSSADRSLGKHVHKIANPVFDARLKHTPKGVIAYVRVPSFSIGGPELVQFGKIIQELNGLKINGLVLDMIDNGGGSLVAGLHMLNMLTENTIKYPALEVMLNDNWYDSIVSTEVYADDRNLQTWAARARRAMDGARKAGARISKPIPSESLSPYLLSKEKLKCSAKSGLFACLKKNTKIVLLVNEMCASMCDIFASSFKDNKLGTIIGSKSMGAGGNVTNHAYSPISKVMLRQTESLVVDINGGYLENMGVVPHILTDTVKDRKSKFKLTLAKAFKILQ